MEWIEHLNKLPILIQILLVAACTPFIALAMKPVMAYYKQTKTLRQELMKDLLDEIGRHKKIIDDRETELNAFREEVEDLKLQLLKMANRVALMESSHFEIPIPWWFKDENGVMLAMSKEYEEEFLKPRGLSMQEYQGQSDQYAWPEELAKKMRAHDKQVFNSGKPWLGYEEIINASGEVETWLVKKWPRMAGNTKIGTGGMAIRNEMTKPISES